MALPVVLINLDRDRERLEWMEAQFATVGLEFRRFSAFLPEDIPKDHLDRFATDQKTVLLPAERACFSSHLAVLEQISKSEGEQIFLVCEDDLIFADDFYRVVTFDFEKLGADIVRLNGLPKEPSFLVEPCSGPYKVVRYGRIPNGTGAYLITPKGAEKVLRNAYGINIPFDDFLRRSWVMDLETYGIVPPPLKQEALGTSTMDPAQKRQMKRRHFHSANDSHRGRIKARIKLAREVGLVKSAKYLVALARMKLLREEPVDFETLVIP